MKRIIVVALGTLLAFPAIAKPLKISECFFVKQLLDNCLQGPIHKCNAIDSGSAAHSYQDLMQRNPKFPEKTLFAYCEKICRDPNQFNEQEMIESLCGENTGYAAAMKKIDAIGAANRR